jgi:hypothetical protein
MEACQHINEFIQEVIDEDWFMKTLNWSRTKQQLEDCEKDLAEVAQLLEFSAVLSTHTMVTNFEMEAKRVDEKVVAAGGIDKFVKDDDALKQLISGCKGFAWVWCWEHGVVLLSCSSLNPPLTFPFLCMLGAEETSGTDQVQLQLLHIIKEQVEGNSGSGPWESIGHKTMKVIGKQIFREKEDITWDTFFTYFPKQVGGWGGGPEADAAAALRRP